MTTFSPQFEPFAQRMKVEALPDLFIRTFAHYYEQLARGETGLIPEADIRPVRDLPDLETLPARLAEVGEAVLARTAVIKLNGGLGTSMGLEQAKSLLRVKDNLTFLDIIARQALHAGVRLILMNSFATRRDSLALLKQYPALWHDDVPLDFLQHKAPKVNRADLSMATWPANPELEWAPPGHGDLYTALVTSGTLEALLTAGYEYAFVSNADNLGAVLDTAVLGYLVENDVPFLMEVADRTAVDRKGGHLAQRPDGQLILRESAQCPDEDHAAFQDITRHHYFNTNNLWFRLSALQAVMAANNQQLYLPMIRNAKTVDPRDNQSTPVYQLETAMGSAIAVFEGAQALRVPRSRFAPVKTTDDLLAVRSDAYSLTADFRVMLDPARSLPPEVMLDPRYYKFVSDLEQRFPEGTPSLIQCRSFVVQGDFRFGRHVTCRGAVRLVNDAAEPIIIPDEVALGE